jgi:GNAT superfamily N-acetyltransferase
VAGPGANVTRICAAISHPRLGAITVGPIAAERAYALRQQVLRPHERVEEMASIDTGDPQELVLGARTARGEIVGTGVVAPGAAPAILGASAASRAAWRIRGMATRADARGVGIASAILVALVAHVTARGGRLVWCNARVAAQRFYERAGFVTAGDVWMEPDIGPHVVMWRRVESPAPP